MTLENFSPLLDRYAACGKQLADSVATRDTTAIEQASRKLADMTLVFQQALPNVLSLLATIPAHAKQEWTTRLEAAAFAVNVGVNLSDLNASTAAARLALLAQASGADLSYAKNGQLGLSAR